MINESATIVKQMQKENKNRIKIIISIMSLDTNELDIKAIKNCMKAFGLTIQHRLNASANKITTSQAPTTTSVTLSNDIKEI